MASDTSNVLDDLDEALGGVLLSDAHNITKVTLRSSLRFYLKPNSHMQKSLVHPTEEDEKAILALVESLLVEGNSETLYTVGTGGERMPRPSREDILITCPVLEGEPSGLPDDEAMTAIANLSRICEKVGAATSEVRRRQEENGVVVELLLRKK